MSPRKLALSVPMLVLALASCGRQPAQDASASSSNPPSFAPADSEFERMFEHPIPPGEQKASVDEAQQESPFQILRPAVGDPLSVWISKVEYQNKQGTAIALVYASSSYGRIVVLETLDPVDFTSSEKWATEAAEAVAASGKPGHYGTSQWVTLRGHQALLGVHPSGRIGLSFFENGVLFQMFSPDLSKDEAVAIAEGMK